MTEPFDPDNLLWDTINEWTLLSTFRSGTLAGFDLLEHDFEDKQRNINKKISGMDKGALGKIRAQFMMTDSEKPVHKEIAKNKDTYIESINKSVLIYACSIFDGYLHEVMRRILKQNPNKLPSEIKPIPFHDLLQKNKEELIEKTIDRYIHELSYKSISDRLRQISNRLELDIVFVEGDSVPTLFSTEVNIRLLTEIFATRNVIVHNQGRVNQIYLDTVKSSPFHLHDKIPIDQVLLEKTTDTFIKTATALAQQITIRYY